MKLGSYLLFLGLTAVSEASVAAKSGRVPAPPDPGVLHCVDRAAAEYRIDTRLLRAMAKVESGFNPRAVGCDPDGGCGRGVMQIRHDLNRLDRYGVQKRDLDDPCTNTYIGAWVLSNCFRRHGVTWEGVGCYNAKSPKKRNEYAWRVYRAMNQIR